MEEVGLRSGFLTLDSVLSPGNLREVAADACPPPEVVLQPIPAPGAATLHFCGVHWFIQKTPTARVYTPGNTFPDLSPFVLLCSGSQRNSEMVQNSLPLQLLGSWLPDRTVGSSNQGRMKPVISFGKLSTPSCLDLPRRRLFLDCGRKRC